MQRLRIWLWKLRFNFFPAYRGSGARVTFIAPDWREVRVQVPLSWRTRNYVGTTFGGSMYAAADPIYMMMLIQVLGPAYVVWDKAASVRFLDSAEAADVFRTYESKYPRTAAKLMQVMEVSYDGTDEDRLRMMDRIPMVAFKLED